MYFLVGKSINMRPYRGHAEDPKTLHRVRDRVERQVNRQIALVRQYRARRDRGSAVRRLLSHL
jgi:hypothetical protein